MIVTKSYRSTFIILILILILCLLANLSFGSVLIPWRDVLLSLLGGTSENPSWSLIVLNYRLPKAITAMIIGSGLSVSGLLMQTFFRNPLAGPFVLGISSGASLGVSLLLLGSTIFTGVFAAILNTSWGLAIAASMGSIAVLMVVLTLSIRIKDTMSLLIIGLMFGSFSSAIISIFIYFAPAAQLQKYVLWGMGSLGSLTWNDLMILFVIYFIGIGITILAIKELNMLLLGEKYARSIGLQIKKSRFLIILATGLLAGSSMAFAGPIAFVGLAVPHMTRLIFTTSSHKVLLPAVILVGSILLLICDTVAQLPGSTYTLPINAITAFLGAPVVIWLVISKRKVLF